ncbi:unnamed protein product [Gongylonema pulchrum]|uniref:GPI mannosyltransferase 2 n=1 Tax=Gongylonema pulchrum TaxID=637853 RepID=A0A183D077_9BILA|nr:unnamed protein product [Gongylonema pulchrum]
MSTHLPSLLSVKYQLNENIRTTKLMFTTIIATIATILYNVPVTLYHGVDVKPDGLISNATLQRVIAYAPWEATIVCPFLLYSFFRHLPECTGNRVSMTEIILLHNCED